MTTSGPNGSGYREPNEMGSTGPTPGAPGQPSYPTSPPPVSNSSAANPATPTPSTPAPSTPSSSVTASPDASEGFSKEEFVATLKKWAIILVVGLIAAIIAAAVIPRWWSQQVGNVVNGSMTSGTITGLVIGFVCVLLPLLLLAWAVRSRETSWLSLTLLVLTFVTAIPNLATLWVVIGNGGGAEAGRQVLTVEAPGFRGGSLVGALVGFALGGYLLWGIFQRDRQAKKLAEANAVNTSGNISGNTSGNSK